MRLEWHSGCDILGRIEKVVTEVVSVFWGSGDTPPPLRTAASLGLIRDARGPAERLAQALLLRRSLGVTRNPLYLLF